MLGLRSVLKKMGAICAACMLAGILCIVFPLRVQSAEDSGIPQPSSAKVYSSMSDSSVIVANLIVGNVFEVVGADHDGDGNIWYKVRTDFGAEGYVKAGELDRLIMDAQAMVPPAVTTDPEDNAAEEPQPEEDPISEDEGNVRQEQENNNRVEESAGNIDITDDNAVGEPVPEDGDNMEDPDGEAVSVNDSDDEEIVTENSTEQVVDSGVESANIDGAGFGIVVDSQISDNGAVSNEGFTVVERTEEKGIYGHGRIDVMLLIIIAGGILCIMAIAALARRMWTCIKTEV